MAVVTVAIQGGLAFKRQPVDLTAFGAPSEAAAAELPGGCQLTRFDAVGTFRMPRDTCALSCPAKRGELQKLVCLSLLQMLLLQCETACWLRLCPSSS